MSGSGLRAVREIGADAAECAALDTSNAKTLDSMDTAITGIREWQMRREMDMMQLRQKLLSEEREDEEDAAREDTVALAMEQKLQKELAALQSKRQAQLSEAKEGRPESDPAFAELCVQRNLAKYGLSEDQLHELTATDSQSAKDLAKVQAQVRQLRANTEASSITAQCRSAVDESEVEKQAGMDGLDDANKMQHVLEDYTSELDDVLLKLNALSSRGNASSVDDGGK
jgi:hypothetical protein|eukprot:Stramenopile-MAST_4_protein_2562